MKLSETIDECIHEMQENLDTWKYVKDKRTYFESPPCLVGVSSNELTIKEIDDTIVEYQKHLDNLNLLKKRLNYE